MPNSPFETAFAESIYTERYKHPQDRNWSGTSRRVVAHPFKALEERYPTRGFQQQAEATYELFVPRLAVPGGRYLYATGRDFHQVNNCVLLNCPDSREGWATTSFQAEMALMTGAGIGIYYGDVRASGESISRTGGLSAGPVPKMQQINETGRHILAGGNRRSAIWAGLPWWHPDIFEFIVVKDWSEEVKALKAADPDFLAPMDKTNISVCLDDEFFAAYGNKGLHPVPLKRGVTAPDGGTWEEWAHRVYDTAVTHMLKHGEPGFSVDVGDKADEKLRNACTEITSADDSDVCNLGSLVLSRFDDVQKFEDAVRTMSIFLTAGSVYSELPYAKVGEIRDKNRRLGLGLIGVHEFCMKHGTQYGSDESFEVLEPFMERYSRALEFAHDFQSSVGLSLSKGATAIAPNGTIGIVAESTPSADPLFSAAERRDVKRARASGGDDSISSIVVDPVAKRLRAEGVPSNLIEDAYSLSVEPERRLGMTAFLQQYVDHAISGTANIPAIVTDPAEAKAFGDTLYEFLPQIRGITVYPEGARAGQPRTPVDLDWALENEGTILETDDANCNGGVCGI